MTATEKKVLLTRVGVRIGFAGFFLAGASALLLAREGERNTEVSLSSKVSQLVDATTRNDSEARAFSELQALGDSAVPFIISHLDDMRTLPDPQISFGNRATNAFETRAQYGAEVVHDSLAAILRQMTGQDIGAFDADRPSSERKALRWKNRAQWLNWCRSRFADRAADCGPQLNASRDRHYNFFRDYDPQMGRYVPSDPIGLDGALNTFA